MYQNEVAESVADRDEAADPQLRVVHFCKSFSPLSETFIYDAVCALEKEGGIESHVLTMERVDEERRPFPRTYVEPWPAFWESRRMASRVLGLFQQRRVEVSFWSALRPRLAESIRCIDPDVVHAHYGTMAVLVAPVARKLGIPLVVSFYGYDASRVLTDSFWLEQYRSLWKDVAVVIALSEVMRQRLLEAGCPASNLTVAHLGRRLDCLPDFRAPSKPVERLVSIGRLTEKKGHIDALSAIYRLRSEGSQISLRIIGEGDLRSGLESFIRDHGLEDAVSLLGARPNSQALEELHGADAFLLCSRTAENGDEEGTPTVLIEAQAAGLPCLATRHSGIPEMIPGCNQWLLAEEGNVEEISDRLRQLTKLSTHDLQQVARAGRRKVESEFNADIQAERVKRVYAAVVSGFNGSE